MAPGITGGGSGRPRPAPLVQHWSCLVPKEEVPITVLVGADKIEFTDVGTVVLIVIG